MNNNNNDNNNIMAIVTEDFYIIDKNGNKKKFTKNENINISLKYVNSFIKKNKIKIDTSKYDIIIKSNLLSNVLAQNNEISKTELSPYIIIRDTINNQNSNKSIEKIIVNNQEQNAIVYDINEFQKILNFIENIENINDNDNEKDKKIQNIIVDIHKFKQIMNGKIDELTLSNQKEVENSNNNNSVYTYNKFKK